MRGSEHNDPIVDAAGHTATNHAGGIAGGLTNGNELVVRAAFKPTASIGRPQNTYNRMTEQGRTAHTGGTPRRLHRPPRGRRRRSCRSHCLSRPAPPMTTRRDILQRIAVPLVPLYGEREARSIALLAASELSGLPETAFLTDPQAEIVVDGLDAIIEQLTAGRPVQYVIGTAEFLGQQFVVREGVLIPRPETEELVTWILREERQATSILDVGTGSGCIAATLAMELPHTDVSAADISEDALAVAAENCRRLGVRVDLRRADALNDLTEVFTGPFDIIVSNPPYVPQSDRATMHPKSATTNPLKRCSCRTMTRCVSIGSSRRPVANCYGQADVSISKSITNTPTRCAPYAPRRVTPTFVCARTSSDARVCSAAGCNETRHATEHHDRTPRTPRKNTRTSAVDADAALCAGRKIDGRRTTSDAQLGCSGRRCRKGPRSFAERPIHRRHALCRGVRARKTATERLGRIQTAGRAPTQRHRPRDRRRGAATNRPYGDVRPTGGTTRPQSTQHPCSDALRTENKTDPIRTIARIRLRNGVRDSCSHRKNDAPCDEF